MQKILKVNKTQIIIVTEFKRVSSDFMIKTFLNALIAFSTYSYTLSSKEVVLLSLFPVIIPSWGLLLVVHSLIVCDSLLGLRGILLLGLVHHEHLTVSLEVMLEVFVAVMAEVHGNRVVNEG